MSSKAAVLEWVVQPPKVLPSPILKPFRQLLVWRTVLTLAYWQATVRKTVITANFGNYSKRVCPFPNACRRPFAKRRRYRVATGRPALSRPLAATRRPLAKLFSVCTILGRRCQPSRTLWSPFRTHAFLLDPWPVGLVSTASSSSLPLRCNRLARTLCPTTRRTLQV